MATEVERLEVERKLKERGWNLTSEGMEMCIQNLGKQKYSMESISNIAADYDLKDIGASILNEDIKRGRASLIEGPIVLQVQKVRNISAPKANEESSFAPRLLKIQLTDGHTTCHALEDSPVQQLSLVTPPGSKICLKGVIPICAGFLLLNANNIVKLGGKVEKILAKWETNRNINEQRSKAILGDEGPPLFIPFQVNTSCNAKKSVDTITKKVKEMSITQNDSKKGYQPKAQPQKPQKSFNQDKMSRAQANANVETDKDNRRKQNNYDIQYSDEQKKPLRKNVQNKERGHQRENRGSKKAVIDHRQHERKDGQKTDRRGGKYDEDHEQRSTKGTLWDFVESTLPVKSSKPKFDDTPKKPNPVDKLPERNRDEIVTKNKYQSKSTNEQPRKFDDGFYNNDNRGSRNAHARQAESGKSKKNDRYSKDNENERRDLLPSQHFQNNSCTTTRNTRSHSGGSTPKETAKQDKNRNHEKHTNPTNSKTKAGRHQDISKHERPDPLGETSEGVKNPSSTKQSSTTSNEKQSTNKSVQSTRIPSSNGGNTTQHWWKKGDRCLAYCPVDGQDNCVASVLEVKPHTRSCLVLFEHSQATESIQWSRLAPLNKGSKSNFNRSIVPDATNPVSFQQVPAQQYGGPIMTNGWLNQPQNPYQYHNPYAPQIVNMGNQINSALPPSIARPTQQFYRPPSRY